MTKKRRAISDKERLDFLVSRLHVVSTGADYREARKRGYTDWATHSFRHWRRWKIGDDAWRIEAIDAAIRAERRGK